MKKKFIQRQLDNKEHIIHIYNMILHDLDNYGLVIREKKNLYEDIVRYLYETTYQIKYIN